MFSSAIDAQKWPGVAQVPRSWRARHRARRAEHDFGRACVRAEVRLVDGPDGEADLAVHDRALFARLAHAGWLGLAESYLAGEWSTPDSQRLVDVLSALIATGYAPTSARIPVEDAGLGELPAQLVALFAGDGISPGGGMYFSGVPTTVRTEMPDYAAGGRGTHLVDITEYAPPQAVDRADLAAAQRRAAASLVEVAQVKPGSSVLVFPAAAMAAALAAAQRRATVDILSPDAHRVEIAQEQLILAGANATVHAAVIPEPVPSPQQVRTRYDAIIHSEIMETLSPGQQRDCIHAMDRLLVPGGHAVWQQVVATEEFSPAARSAIGVLRAYIWPGLDFPTVEQVHKLVERESSLRIIGQRHFGSHYRESLAQQRSFFDGHHREAAAEGFDLVFRRLWTYQNALREALMGLGMLDAIHFDAVHRRRG